MSARDLRFSDNKILIAFLCKKNDQPAAGENFLGYFLRYLERNTGILTVVNMINKWQNRSDNFEWRLRCWIWKIIDVSKLQSVSGVFCFKIWNVEITHALDMDSILRKIILK